MAYSANQFSTPDADLAASKRETAPSAQPEGQLTVDVFDAGDDIIVRSTVAGVNDSQIDISVTSDMITIRGFREPEQRVRQADYYHQELYWGPFSRSIILPVDVDADGAKASLKNGILTVRLPKLERRRTKKVSVSV